MLGVIDGRPVSPGGFPATGFPGPLRILINSELSIAISVVLSSGLLVSLWASEIVDTSRAISVRLAMLLLGLNMPFSYCRSG